MSEERKEYTLEIGKVNLYSLFLVIPITAIYLIPFILIWDYQTFEIGRKEFMSLFFYMFVLGIITHEFLHGITPYCHCKEPLKVKHYVLGGMMPLLVMGILPALTGLFLGNGLYLSLGIFFSWTAGGDIISLFMLRKFNKNTMVSDHPNKMGFYISD